MPDLINENDAESIENPEINDDTDADAFAILSLLFIVAATIVYYLSY